MKNLFFTLLFLLALTAAAELIPIKNESYVGIYDTVNHCAVWIGYILTDKDIEANYCRYAFYRSDTRFARAILFTFSGQIRGHLCASEAKGKLTFDMCNIVPQDAVLNCGLWKEIEIYERKTAVIKGRIIVIVGPVFKPDNNRWIKMFIRIPDQFFKIIYNDITECYLVNNEPLKGKNPSDYLVDISVVEQATGLNFETIKKEIEK